MSNLLIRTETPKDYAIVERIVRDSFWNLYVPGCDEHYLTHIMRKHPDFIPELDFVIERNGQVIGNVMYTKAKLTDEAGETMQILTFGPVAIHPDYQRKGYGRKLLEHSFQKAAQLGYDVIVILGSPDNYVGHGFKSCKKYNVCMEDGVFLFAMLLKELTPGVLDGRKWYYQESPVYNIDSTEAQKFDEQFEFKEKKYQPSQEVFYIQSHSVLR